MLKCCAYGPRGLTDSFPLVHSATPEMLNWMLPADKRRPFSKGKEKPWQYFVKANHPDVVELAMVRPLPLGEDSLSCCVLT